MTRVAHGRWAPSRFHDCFGLYQNVLRIILIAFASLGTEPKEVVPPGLMYISNTRSLICIINNQKGHIVFLYALFLILCCYVFQKIAHDCSERCSE